MSKHRVVKSDFWVDDYIEGLTVFQRYFFLYLLTNPNTNILGIYQTTLNRMCFETGLEENQINDCLLKFSNDDKVHFISNHILMVNFQRHQNPSGTMKHGIIKLINSLPKEVIDFIYSKKSRIYDRLYIGYLIDYIYPNDRININIDIDKDKDKSISPISDMENFLNNIPETISSKWTTDQIKNKTDDMVNYCKSKGKKYKDYYATLRNFLKKDFPNGNDEGQYDFV